jgi:hypothetical protein
MLVRRNGETLGALLKRLDRAVASYYDDGETVDDVNGPSSWTGRQDGTTGRLVRQETVGE